MVLAKLLKRLSMELRATEEGQQQLLKYREMQKTPGWKVYQTLIVTVANGMTQYLLSKEFTEQDAATKDREQWAMFHTKEMVEFLLDPLTSSEATAKIQAHNTQMAASIRPAKKKG